MEKYERLELEVIELSVSSDVITASNDPGCPNETIIG